MMGLVYWTEEREQRLRAFWRQGLTASEIAKRLGEGLSREAICGKARRLCLASRDYAQSFVPIKPFRKFARKPGPPSSERANAVGALNAPPSADGASLHLSPLVSSVLDLKPHHCRFPIGDPTAEGFGFCGHARRFIHPHVPYCDFHMRYSHQGKQ